MHWDAVVIDESHNLIGESSLRNKLARRLAPHTDALLLASATPHNGDAESFAELISMLDPAAIADKRQYEPKDIEHLYIRRTKISPEVTNEIGGKWRERGPSQAGPLPGHPEGGAGLRRAHRHLARRATPQESPASGACSRTPCSRRSSPRTRPSRRPRRTA